MSTSRMKFSPVERRTVADEVREALIESIRAGEMVAGERIPSERDLCEEFGVARTTVREALQGLVTMDLLEKRGNRLFIAERLPDVRLDQVDKRKRAVEELFEVRQIVEVPITRLAACHATEAQREQIASVAERFNEDMTLYEFRRLDREFHWLIAGACGNETLAELYGKVLDSLFSSEDFEQILGADVNEEAVKAVITNASTAHKEIAAALMNGDWQAVINSSERHLADVENQMISRMI